MCLLKFMQAFVLLLGGALKVPAPPTLLVSEAGAGLRVRAQQEDQVPKG